MAEAPWSNSICNCSQAPVQSRIKWKFRISVYFDGTGNNKINIDDRKSGKSTNEDDSYLAEYSNVSRLFDNFRNHKGVDYTFRIYIDGIGTTRSQDDNTRGYATGTGDTGIEARVKEAVKEVIDQIKKRGDSDIDYVHLDVFGFSRGAAAARHFVQQIVKAQEGSLHERLTREGLSVGAVAVKFLGLFDTVSSFGLDLDFDDDVKQLGLNEISTAAAVVQLAAAEEYRAKFALTDIRSVSHGIEILLPGAHSDVGGGYNDLDNEEDWIVFDSKGHFATPRTRREAHDNDKKWFTERGWYTDCQLEVSDFSSTNTANRAGISNKYSFIPLLLMQAFAAQNGSQHTPDMKEKKFVVPDDLHWLWQRVEGYPTGRQAGTCADWRNDQSPEMRALRGKYLHFSARYTLIGAHKPRWSDGGPIKGYRERQVHAG